MTDEIKYSVIIPVYNAKKTLVRCVESVLSQKRSDVELVIVNDGSTDESEKIISEYIEKNSNIVYISQKNAGVSRARNVGIENTHGKYITFLDSDD
ncbi:MAG: glycosyltransferase, partial [Clostridiales bacterium]|nr:glycosyltransferase [Clostridiales bacterium]